MKILTTILFVIFITSCTQSNRQFTFEETKFFSPYKPGNIMIFENSQNIIDTFEIIKIDSSIRTDLGFFGHEVQNVKTIFIRQLPIDTSHGLTKNQIEKNKLDWCEFLTAAKSPDENKIIYCLRFKGLESCTENSFGQFIDTVTVMGKRLTNCYTFKNNDSRTNDSNSVVTTVYWTLDSGMVAYKLSNGVECIRKSIR